jgi:hypothetical protein
MKSNPFHSKGPAAGIRVILMTTALFSINGGQAARAQVSSDFYFLKEVATPRAMSLGRCAVAVPGEESGEYNPAIPGVVHLDKTLSISIPLIYDFLPRLTDDLRLKTFGLSAGVSYGKLWPGTISDLDFSLSLGYAKKKFDLGDIYVYDDLGEFVGTTAAYESVDIYSISMGAKYYIKAGIGYSYKAIESFYPYYIEGDVDLLETNARDIGFYLEVPVLELARLNSGVIIPKESSIYYDLNIAVAYAEANMGKDRNRGTGQDRLYSFPQIGRTGFSLLAAMKEGNRSFISVMLTLEKEKDIKYDRQDITKYGIELGLGEILFARGGHYDNDYLDDQHSTWGIGLNIGRALERLLLPSGIDTGNRFVNSLINDIDLILDYAYIRDRNSIYDDTNILYLNLSL